MTQELLSEQEELANRVIGKMDERDLATYILRKKVEEETKSYLNKLWKIITIVGATLGILLGILGYKQYSSFEEIRKSADKNAKEIEKKTGEINAKAKELEEKNKEIEKSIARDKELAELTKSAVEDAKNGSRELIETTRDSANQSYALITQSLGMLTKMYDNLHSAQSKLTATQADIDNQVTIAVRQIDRLSDHEKRINSQLQQATETNAQINSLAEGFRGEYKIVKEQVQEVRDLESVQKQLSQARSLEIVILKVGTPNTIKLIDFDGIKDSTPYDITFRAQQLKKPYQLTVSVGGNRKTNPVKMNCKDIDVGDIYRITNSPFVFKVDFVYHTKLSMDFITLKVAHEGFISTDDKLKLLDCK